MLDASGEHQFLELLARSRHRAIALPERVALHALVLQIDNRLAGVPPVIGRALEVIVRDHLKDVRLDKVIVDDVPFGHFHIAGTHPDVVVDVLLSDLLQHLLLRYPEEGQQLEAISLVEEKHICCDVGDVREVEPAPALASDQILRGHLPAAAHPRIIEDPCLLRIHPQIDVLRHHISHSLRTVLRIGHLIGQVVSREGHSEIGIALDPHLGVIPLRRIIEGVDNAEQCIIAVHPSQDFYHIVPVGVAGSVLIEAGGGDDEHQGLASGTEG